MKKINKSTISLVTELKNENEDFEWYPTTNEIIEAMYWDIKGPDSNGDKNISFLDIGAGNGKIYTKFNEIKDSVTTGLENHSGHYSKCLNINKYMVIEKSQVLINQMPSKAFVVGTDFYENTLIDKQAHVVFCNPPYSEYSNWTERIITEANADFIYLVIPQRWDQQENILASIKKREAEFSIVGNYSFENSEDRKARAVVDLIRIDLTGKGYNSSYMNVDPFDLWFNENFKINANKDNYAYRTREEEKSDKERQEKIDNYLVEGIDLVSSLVKIYTNELSQLIETYSKLSELDPIILDELNVKVDNVKAALKQKIEHLKSLYWKEIFNNLSDITKRLTGKTRGRLLEFLTSNTNIDFTTGNIRSLVIWVIKNANNYYNDQMISVYDNFTTGEGIKLYKSNKRFNDDTWRYNRSESKDLDKYALDYRIVLHGYRSEAYSWQDDDFKYSNNQLEYLKDIIVIAKNLGFSIEDEGIDNILIKEKNLVYLRGSSKRILKVGQKTNIGVIQEVYLHTTSVNPNNERTQLIDGVIHVYEETNTSDEVQYKINNEYVHWSLPKIESDVFTTVKAFKNGNVHFQLNKNFIKKLNLEVGRLRGWLKDPLHATEEFDITLDEAQEYWNSNFVITAKDVKNLLPEKVDSNSSSNTIKEVKDETLTLDVKEDVEIHLDDERILGADGNTYVQSSLF